LSNYFLVIISGHSFDVNIHHSICLYEDMLIGICSPLKTRIFNPGRYRHFISHYQAMSSPSISRAFAGPSCITRSKINIELEQTTNHHSQN
jgi:hypothetical protein